MTLHEAFDECTICDLFNKNVSDEHKIQVIDRIRSVPNTKVPKVKLCNIIAWLSQKVKWQEKRIEELEKENAELRRVAEFQQSNNMNRHFENKKLKECLTVGTTWNKALNSMNKALEEERDKYRNMVFDKGEQLSKAKELIKRLINVCCSYGATGRTTAEAEQFLKEVSE